MTDRPASGFRRLFQPLTIGNFEVRNRIVNPAHGTALPEYRELRYLRDRARGGTGLIGIQAAAGVREFTSGPASRRERPDWDQLPPSGTSDAGIAFYDEQVVPRLQARADIVHAEGARCYGQVFHLGAAAHSRAVGVLVSPSAVADPYEARVPHALARGEISELVELFAHGVRRVRDAGLDAAEVHAAHGYLISQFLSPYFNRRNDDYGGSARNRLRFLEEILTRSREFVGDFPIGVRLGSDGLGKSGLTVEQVVGIAARLGPSLAFLSVSGGNYAGVASGPTQAYVAPWYEPPGANIEVSTQVKDVVDVPVIVTGRINDAALAERILADGSADLVGMVRSLIADPELPSKVLRGEYDRVRMCLGVSECHAIGAHRTPIACAVNAAAGREAELELVPVQATRTVVVVGAGPAGMEAARVAAERGHVTYLCDAERLIGGLPRLLGRDPNRRNLLDHAAFFETRLTDLGVNLILGNHVDADELLEFGPDVVVVATGGNPVIPDVPGILEPHVHTALEVLRGTASLHRRVLVVGGLDDHVGAPTIAEFLVDQGREVEFASGQADFAPGAEDGTRIALLARLARKGVRPLLHHELVHTEGGGAVLRDSFTEQPLSLVDVDVVLACGMAPDDSLAGELRGRIREIHVVGDALAPRRIIHATLDGARVANRL